MTAYLFFEDFGFRVDQARDGFVRVPNKVAPRVARRFIRGVTASFGVNFQCCGLATLMPALLLRIQGFNGATMWRNSISPEGRTRAWESRNGVIND